MKLTKSAARAFRDMIFTWWKDNHRDLPWRHTRDPYRILIAEVMLQQTQVSRVLPKYAEFLDAFPDVYALSAASPARILTAWRGMGYNRRALYLKRAAEHIVGAYNGKFPEDEKLLVKLPGLGTYTARALLVFAFEQDVAMVDTNIRQIITHFFYNGLPQKEKVIQATADLLVPIGKSWQWHQALMDFGALAIAKEKKAMYMVKKQTPFKDSGRYYRGRIIDVLRAGNVNEAELIADFSRQYGKAPDFFHRIIDELRKDGLLERKKNYLKLP